MTQVHHVDAARLASLVSPADAVAAVRDAFIALDAGDFDLPHRISLGNGSALVMPVQHVPSGETVVKALSLDFDREPAIRGTTTWCNRSGEDVVVLDAGPVTALRTGAVVGVATDLLAPPESSSLCVIGAGGQALHLVLCVDAVRRLSRVVVVARTEARAAPLVAHLREHLRPEVAVTVSTSVTESVRGVDLVCCATTATSPLFPVDDLDPGAHVNAIGAYRLDMAELGADVLAAASLVAVDHLPATMAEAGDVVAAVHSGAVEAGRLQELGRLLRVGSPERHGLTVFKSVGLAVQDWAVASLVARRLAAADR